MKNMSKLISFIVVWITTIVVLLFTSQCFAANASQGVSPAKSNGERLIAKNVTYTKAVWCGNNNLVLDAGESGSYLLKLSNSVRRKLANSEYIGAISCSPDGDWLITVDARTNRADRDSAGHVDHGHSVKDYSRINLVSGKSERFVIAQGGGYWSPDGMKVLFLGKEPQLSIKQPAPQWELYWSHDWPSGSGGVAAWLPDSKNVLLGHRGKFYLQRGQELTQLEVIPERSFPNIVQIKIDRGQHFYVSTTDTKTPSMMYQLFSCAIDLTQVNCVKIAAASAGVIAFDISRDGRRLVYVDSDHSHLYLIDLSTKKSKLIAENVEGYPAIAPDGESVVFYRLRGGNTEGMGFDIDNAFVAPLN